MPGSITWMSTSFTISGILLDTYNAVQFLDRIYPQLCAHIDFYVRNANAKTGLVEWDQYGDVRGCSARLASSHTHNPSRTHKHAPAQWNAIVPSNGLFLANVLYHADNLIMASIASALGKSADAAVFLARAAALRDAVYASFFNQTSGVWDTGSQTSQAMALVFNLDPPSAHTVLQHLAADVANRGNHISGGVFGSRYLLQALSMHGRGDVALALATVPTAPSWLAMAVGTPEQPSIGTLWESWDGPIRSGSSGNHPFLGGGAGVWMYHYALGLRFSHGDARAARGAAAGGARACLRRVGLGVDLVASHGIDEGGACALARAVEGLRADAALGAPLGALLSSRSLRSRFPSPAAAAVAAAAAPLSPTGALVLDAALLAALGSASGSLDTPRGRIHAAWSWRVEEGLAVELTVPPLEGFAVFVPAQLLADAATEVAVVGTVGKGTVQWRAVTPGGPGGRMPEGAPVGACAWAAPGEAQQLLLVPGAAAAPAHLKINLAPGAWTVRVRATG